MGLVFFFFPHFYAKIEGANYENIAWLRNLGAALIAINGVGALLAIKDPQKELKLYDVVLLASSLETIGLIWSTIKKKIFFYVIIVVINLVQIENVSKMTNVI